MQYRSLGRSGLRVSAVGLGTNQFGGKVDQAGVNDIIDACEALGINFVDTADMYGKGRSEETLGVALRGKWDRFVVATKGYVPMGDGPNDWGASRYHLMNAVEASLEAKRSTSEHVVITWKTAGSLLEVRIDDDGPGLDTTTDPFVPFFTTKPQGSGIGLALSRQIAEAQSLERLEQEAIRLGFVVAQPEDIEYVLVPDYPAAPGEPAPVTPTPAAVISTPPETAREALWLTFQAGIGDLIHGEASEQ